MEHPIKSEKIVMYSTGWCPDCKRIKALFDKHQVAYLNIDIDQDREASDFVTRFNKGNRTVPTIFFPDGQTMVEPSNRQVEEKLGL